MHDLNRTISRLLGEDETLPANSRVFRGSAGTLVLKVLVSGLFFAISVSLARLLGTTGYGAYSYAISWASVLGVLAGIGSNRMLVREIARYAERKQYSSLKGILRWSDRATIVSSAVTMLLAGLLLPRLLSLESGEMTQSFLVGLLLLPFTALMRIRQSALQGMNKVVRGQLTESLQQPILLIGLIWMAYFIVGSGFGAVEAVGMNVVTVLVGLVFSAWLLHRDLGPTLRGVDAEYRSSEWLRSAVSLMVVAGLFIINNRTDSIMIGSLLNAESVGIYNAAARGSEIALILLGPAGAALGPMISGMYAAGNPAGIQRLLTRAARVVFLLSIPVVLGLMVFGRVFLNLFGADYVAGYVPLVILLGGQAVSVLAGFPILLLIMTGNDRTAAYCVGATAALNIVLNALLIPRLGIAGAALATAICVVLVNLSAVFASVRLTHIDTTTLGLFAERQQPRRSQRDRLNHGNDA